MAGSWQVPGRFSASSGQVLGSARGGTPIKPANVSLADPKWLSRQAQHCQDQTDKREKSIPTQVKEPEKIDPKSPKLLQKSYCSEAQNGQKRATEARMFQGRILDPQKRVATQISGGSEAILELQKAPETYKNS